jgi:hypothetical protein
MASRARQGLRHPDALALSRLEQQGLNGLCSPLGIETSAHVYDGVEHSVAKWPVEPAGD